MPSKPLVASDPSPERKTTRLQEIALEYMQRYWQHLHPEDRIEFLTAMLTTQERRALLLRIEGENPR